MVIVFSSTKGGTGKSTLAFHIAVQAFLDNLDLMTFDYDHPQCSFSTYWKNRCNNPNLGCWPNHSSIQNINEIPDISSEKIVIIDTPGRYDPQLIELHKKADIIITPINDSFLDINTIMKIEKEKWTTFGNYYEFIYDSKNYNENLQWWIVRNRSSSIVSKHSKNIKEKLSELSKKIDFKLLDGPKDRSIFRELFNQGATVLDLKTKLSISNLAAKLEIKSIWKEILNTQK